MITGISLLSCLVICSSGADSASTTIVMRLKRSSSVGLTASETMLNAAPREQARDAREHTGLVLDEDGEDVMRDRRCSCVTDRLRRVSGPRMMSSFDAPGGDHRVHLLAVVGAEVDHDRTVVDLVRLLDRRHDVVGVSTRKPTQPIASAHFT